MDEYILGNIQENGDGSPIHFDIDAYDWYDNPININDLTAPTCIDCNPSPDAPSPPTLINCATVNGKSQIKLEWDSYSNAEYFRIYRCLENETMTNKDVVGITSYFNDNYYEFIDKDPNLIPGRNYKYSVAGVNYNGEGYNSNELSLIYGYLLPNNITSLKCALQSKIPSNI